MEQRIAEHERMIRKQTERITVPGNLFYSSRPCLCSLPYSLVSCFRQTADFPHKAVAKSSVDIPYFYAHIYEYGDKVKLVSVIYAVIRLKKCRVIGMIRLKKCD